MTIELIKIFIEKLTKRWLVISTAVFFLWLCSLEIVVYLLLTFSKKMEPLKTIILSIVFVLFFLVWIFIRKTYKQYLNDIILHINRSSKEFEECAEFFIKNEEQLSLLESMQIRRICNNIKSETLSNIKIPYKVLWKPFAVFCFVLISAISTNAVYFPHTIKSGEQQSRLISKNRNPVMAAQISIKPPNYTNLGFYTQDSLNASIVEGSEVEWTLSFDQEVTKVVFRSPMQSDKKLDQIENVFHYSQKINHSLFYRINYLGTDSVWHNSNAKFINTIKDSIPQIRVVSPKVRTDVSFESVDFINVKTKIRDDFKVVQTRIIATVSKGRGEGIKFREQVIPLEQKTVNPKEILCNKVINFEKLEMLPGDELYFYIESFDNRRPISNRARSETFFVFLKDTSKQLIAESSGMAIDLIPEYFRSQRQIIIDTERLIQDRQKISDRQFKQRSNSLGLDQKSLRLRYGQYLGEEFEGAPEIESIAEDDHGHEHNGDDQESNTPIYKEDGQDQILQKYGHSHDSRENATLFGKSTKTLLKRALAQMWDSELNLRIFKPKSALPFAYKALELIKAVQQANRVYVNKIGFDAPEIDIKKRLTGELSKIINSSQKTYKETIDPLIRTKNLLREISNSTKTNHVIISLLRSSQNELINLLSQENYFQVLRKIDLTIQCLKREEQCKILFADLINEILKILPEEIDQPYKWQTHESPVSRVYFKNLESK